MKKLFALFSGLLLLLSCLAPIGSAQSINPGTEIQVRLLGQLDTGKTEAGQEFSATLAQPVRLDNGMVWPAGTDVRGTVVDVVSSGRLSRPASITLQLTQIGSSPIETQTEQIDGKSHAGRNAALIGGTATLGAILGGIAGGGKGAVIGAAAGAGAGTATAAATGKQEIVLRAETPLTFVVAGDATRSPAEASAPAPESTEAPEPQNPPQASDYYEPYAPEQLDNLLAPIALYPDPLLAQVLVAATFPDEIQDAAPWLRVHNPDSIDYQPWDVSVKAVAHYPTVLSMLNDRLDWTTALGQAYVNQSSDVMMSVQRLRNMAYSQGNLVPTPQQQVVVDHGYIQIVPAQPRVIFVPEYDPGVIYARRVYRPGFGFDGFFNFGTGFVIGSWLNHDMDWGAHRVVYNSWDERGGWRERSRPYVHITNVYVNNRYENVNVNRNVVDRHVDYDNVQRYNSVHREVTYENRARIEGARVRNEPPRVGQQPRPEPANERVDDRDDRGFHPEHPDNARFERPNQTPPNAEQPQPQPANERVDHSENDHGFRGQPSSQGQPAAPQYPNNASFERPNRVPPNAEQPQHQPANERVDDSENDHGFRGQPSSQGQPAAPQHPNNASFERPNRVPPNAEQPQPQPANVRVNGSGNDRNARNQSPSTPVRTTRTAPQPTPHAAPPATQPKVQQQQHSVDKNSKDKNEGKK
ncbi:MAG TPA: DUF3300 domain-containing protein [Candidatus Methylomirabilis sp.]|nr:DUF3300 domain-containing protein [Candidatus Methylomirabilis sp.]